jgi:hypothetical protein
MQKRGDEGSQGGDKGRERERVKKDKRGKTREENIRRESFEGKDIGTRQIAIQVTKQKAC